MSPVSRKGIESIGGLELPPPPHGQRAPVDRSSASVADLPGWADELATILAYAVVFYGITAGLHAVNIKGGWIVAAALLGVVWMLRSYLVEPIAGLLRQIILAGFHILVELLDFVRQWLEGVAHYFQGNLIRAITRILVVAAFLWIWDLALSIPVIRDLFDSITQTAGQVLRWINNQIDSVRRVLIDLRDDVNGRLTMLLDRIGLANSSLRDELVGQVDALFGILVRQVGRFRAQLLARVDVMHNLTHARITLLGQTVAIAPRLVNERVVAAFARAGGTHVTDAIVTFRSVAARYSPPGALHGAPWEVADEFQAELAAAGPDFLPYPIELADEAREHIKAVQRGAPPTEIAEWPVALREPEVTTDQMPVSAGEYAAPWFPPAVPPDEPP